jgi:glycosyltransferase involved in cell wall biosynthesis
MKVDAIISLQPEGWHEEWQTPHHLMRALARHLPVYFVSEPAGNGRLWGGADWQEPEKNLFVFQDRWWMTPQGWSWRVQKSMLRYRARQVAAAVGRQGVRAPVVYLWSPSCLFSVPQIRHGLLCYHIVDEYSRYVGAGEGVTRLEDEVLRRADAVFAITARILERRRDRIRGLRRVVGNGVDFEYFATVAAQLPLGHARVQQLPRPRAGYVGRLNTKVDLELLCHLADCLPCWQYVLVGPARFDRREEQSRWKSLIRRPNVHYLGACPAQEVPAFMLGLDVGMMPYKADPSLWCYEGYPLKLHEYLAVGVPVVGSNIPVLRAFADWVRVCGSHEEWRGALEGIRNDSKMTSEVARDIRRNVAMAHSWADIAKEVLKHLECVSPDGAGERP